MLLLAGVGAMLLLTWHWPRGGLTEEGWPGRAIARAAGLVLTIGAAAGPPSWRRKPAWRR